MEYLAQKCLDLVMNIPKNFHDEELANDYLIRRRTVDFGIPLSYGTSSWPTASRRTLGDLHPKSWAEYGGRPARYES